MADDVTRMLQGLSAGDSAAAEELLLLVYENLRALARSSIGHGAGLTLQPTALVHEVYLKLGQAAGANWNSRAHFMAVAATAMRQIVRDRARRRKAEKRGGDRHRLTLTGLSTPAPDGVSAVDLIALDEALTKLAALNERQSRLVELRFFGGLSNDETAEVLGLTTRTVEKDWARTRAWLSRELSGSGT